MARPRRLKVLSEGVQDAPGARVAFATSDLKHVDQHFGSAAALAVYVVSVEKSALIEVTRFDDHAQDGNEDKLAAKMAVLEGCVAVYCQAVGSSAIAQMRALGVQPIKVDPGAPIPRLLSELRLELRDSPNGWLARAVSGLNKDPERFSAMAAETWNE
ncbi:MAG: nitrogen fixation protein NifX [Alphaproteobacteria bacterium RIFOXYD12_FULL_60_8]|nr:MAG: nitrogen fixation protein NifX [Alphaproteobacteria bacterium RIFOXYD12_FULL_60_8]